MFDFVAKNKRLIQVILAIIFLPFAFFGIDAYFRGGGVGEAVARVGDYKISQEEFARALRDRQDELRRLAQGRVDPAMLDSREMRVGTLENMIRRRLLLEGALRAGVTLNDDKLQELIGKQQLFQDEAGKFSMERYQQFHRAEGRTAVGFEAQVRQDILLGKFADGYADTSFAPRSVVERLARRRQRPTRLGAHVGDHRAPAPGRRHRRHGRDLVAPHPRTRRLLADPPENDEGGAPHRAAAF